MRDILQGFTMWMDGVDHGIATEEVTLPIPTPKMQEYHGGGTDLAVNMPMLALEAMEVTVKMAGQDEDILRSLALAPGRTKRLTFRGAILEEMAGDYVPHVCIVEGHNNAGSRDTWQRGEKSGVEFMVNGIIYYRYDIRDTVVHHVEHYPPVRIINGIDQLSEVNEILGY